MKSYLTSWIVLPVLCVLLNCAMVKGEQGNWESDYQTANRKSGEGDYLQAMKVMRMALAEAEIFGPDDNRVAMTLNNLGTIYQYLGRYTEAEKCYRRSMLIWQKSGNDFQVHIATSLNNLASLYKQTGQYSKAVSYWSI